MAELTLEFWLWLQSQVDGWPTVAWLELFVAVLLAGSWGMTLFTVGAAWRRLWLPEARTGLGRSIQVAKVATHALRFLALAAYTVVTVLALTNAPATPSQSIRSAVLTLSILTGILTVVGWAAADLVLEVQAAHEREERRAAAAPGVAH